LAWLGGGSAPRADRSLVPAERRLEPGRGDGGPADPGRLIGDGAGEQLVRLERRRRNGGLAVIDPGLVCPLGGGGLFRPRVRGVWRTRLRLRRRGGER